MPKTLVTGGNIGNHVAEGLAKAGVAVRVIVRAPAPNRTWSDLGIEQVTANLESVASLAPIFEDVNHFFSLTPFVENLEQLGANTIEAARKAGVSYVVRSSLYGASDDGIAMRRAHRAVEKAVERSGIPYTIIRPNSFMDSYFMHADAIKGADAFYLPQGDGKVSLVDVRDIAAVAVACLTQSGHSGKTYSVTGSEALSNGDIAGKLSAALGRRISYYDVTPAQAEDSMLKAGVPAWMAASLLELFHICKEGLASEVTDVVERVLHREPITFKQFLADNLQVFSKQQDAAGVA